MSNKLSPREQRLVDAISKGEQSVDDLYRLLYPEQRALPVGKRAHQYVGAVVSRVNLKLNDRHIVPGSAKRTYTLYKKIDAAVS